MRVPCHYDIGARRHGAPQHLSWPSDQRNGIQTVVRRYTLVKLAIAKTMGDDGLHRHAELDGEHAHRRLRCRVHSAPALVGTVRVNGIDRYGRGSSSEAASRIPRL